MPGTIPGTDHPFHHLPHQIHSPIIPVGICLQIYHHLPAPSNASVVNLLKIPCALAAAVTLRFAITVTL